MRNFQREGLSDWVSALCTVFMLCFVPLLFRNAFFDINRVKVEAVCRVMPWIAVAMALAAYAAKKKVLRRSGFIDLPSVAMFLFLAFCIVSCAFAGFERAVINGSEGRYCGLAFMLCCGAAYFVISMGRCNGKLLSAVMICAAIVSGLGFANAIGLDPLGFYARIKKGQEHVYLSTIGHFDFFGTYIVMLFPFAGAQYVYADSKAKRIFGLICAIVLAHGAMASRTDSAVAGLHLGCYLLFALSGGSMARLIRALALWAISFAALPITFRMLARSPYHPEISGFPKLLFDLHVCEIASLVLLAVVLLCLYCSRRGFSAPGRRKLALIMLGIFVVCAMLLFGSVVYFSVFDTQTDLGSAASFLRFDDRWGSLRGFAWIRSIRAFSDYDLRHKLFGAGMELTLRVLKPYFDDPAMLVGGVFNDPHCQILQILLTCGLLGAILFSVFYLLMLFVLVRGAGCDPLLVGALGSIFSYSIILLINVTQPILIATYFAICGLSVSVLKEKKIQGGKAR